MARILIALAFVLVGCASEEAYRKALASWIGAPKNELIASMGPPTHAYRSDASTEWLTWDRGNNVPPMVLPGSATTTISGNTAYTTTSPGIVVGGYRAYCRASFKVMNSIIQSYRYEGNYCKQ